MLKLKIRMKFLGNFEIWAALMAIGGHWLQKRDHLSMSADETPRSSGGIHTLGTTQ